MKIAFIQVVRDDTDILFNNWTYYYNIGIRDYFIMLHMPTPESYRVVEDFKEWHADANIRIFVNSIDNHYHEKDAKILIGEALKDGFNWVIASDADELLILKSHNTINDFLSQYKNVPTVLRFKWVDYRGDREIHRDENAFVEMKYMCINFMDADDPNWLKSCGYFNDRMNYVPGFHNISNCENIINVNPDMAYYAHFPDRNFKQYREKILIQQKNWLQRYGYFYSKDELTEEFISFLWSNRIISNDGQRQVCKSDKYNNDRKIYYMINQINQRLFQL